MKKTLIQNFMHHWIFIVIPLLFNFSVKSQTIQWTRTYGSTGQDGGEAMVLTSDGGIVITGFKSAGNLKNVLLMKTDSQGNELWSRTFDLGLNDIGRSLRQTSDGGFIICGMTEVSPQIFDPFLIKTDSEGTMQWYQQYDYGFGDDDKGHSVWQTSDGGYILAGQTWIIHGFFGSYDMYIVKTNANGNVQWSKIFYWEEEDNDIALSVQQLNDNGYIIGGLTQSSSWASYILRTDSLGNIVWENIYPGVWQSECYHIQATPDRGFIFTGAETNFTTDADVILVKLNSDGLLQWKKIYGTVDSDWGESISQLPDGGYAIAGVGGNGPSYDFYVIRTNSIGNQLWSITFGGSSDDRGFSIVTNPDGSHLVTGWTWSYGQGLGDVYLVKIIDSVVPVELTNFTARVDEDFVILNWSTSTETNNSGFGIQRKQVLNQHSAGSNSEWVELGFVIGNGTTTETHSYSFVDKNLSSGKYLYRLKQVDYNGSFTYSDSIEVEVNSIPVRFSLEQNYPNPFNPSTIIKFQIPEAGFVSLKIYNVLGNEVATLVYEEKHAGNHEVRFNASALSSGTYLYKLDFGNYSIVKKLLVIK